MNFIPSYIKLYQSGELQKRLKKIENIYKECTLCPQECKVDRTKRETGICNSRKLPIVSSYNAHFGEEAPLVGRKGSGTIFFTNCNLKCLFCQNYDISHLGHGNEITYKDLAMMMMSLQRRGCHNINLVTPTHMIYAILKALIMAVDIGLKLPLVYNSGGYDSAETLRLIEGVFDIYMPDFKYSKPDIGYELSSAENYPQIAKSAIAEMYSQVGDLKTSENGIAYRGLLVRHLILPDNLAETDGVIQFIANLSRNTYLNLMDQYRPQYHAWEHPGLKRRITLQEYNNAIDLAKKSGILRFDHM